MDPLGETEFRKYSFIYDKRPVNICNDRKAQKQLVRRNCKYFS